MTFQELTLPLRGKTVVNQTMDKKKVRKMVSIAFSLYKDNEISKEMLDTLAEMALAWEITACLEAKLNKKADRLLIYE
jgi:hypothetical protein